MSSGADSAVDFLVRVRPRGPWNLTAITPDVAGAESAAFTDPDQARNWLAKRVERQNLYWMPNPAPAPSGAAGRAVKSDVPRTEFRHVDIDLDKLSPDHPWQGLDLAGRKAEAVKMLHQFDRPGPPTVIIDSGGGLQPLWRLETPTGRAADGIDERQNEKLIQLLGGDVGTQNVDRLLRLPGTMNFPDARKRKRGRVTAPARLIEMNDRTYVDFEFEAAPKRETTEVDIQIGPPESVPDLDLFAEEFRLPERLVTIIRDGRLPEAKERDDSRSAWVFDCVLGLVRAKVPNEYIAGILLDSTYGISESILEKGEQADERAAARAILNAHKVALSQRDDDFPDDDVAQESAAERATRTARYAPLTYSDLLGLPIPRWLVDHWVTEGGLFTVFGAEKMFKSFIVLDLSLCIATGLDWHGVKVKQGRVKYIIGEGNARRFADRITAWRIHNRVAQQDVDANFRVVPVRVGVDNKQELAAFFDADHSAYDLVVVDTVARNMDGDENATRDMNIMVKGADRIREVHHSAVALVHHSGKDISKGARGSTALTGAVDANIHVTKNPAGQSVVTLKNARDSESGASLVFEPLSVFVSDPDDEEARTSLVMRFVRAGDEDDRKDTPESKTAVDKVLVALAGRGSVLNMAELVDPEEKGMSRANVQKAFRKLIEDQLVADGPPYACTPVGLEVALQLGAAVPDEP